MGQGDSGCQHQTGLIMTFADELSDDRRPAKVLAYERHDPRDKSLEWLIGQGVDVHFGSAQTDPTFRRYTEDAIIEQASGFDAVIGSSSAHFTRRVLEALPELGYIAKCGIGVDTIDVQAATERGILVANTPEEVGVIAVAEHAIGMMLALRKRLHEWSPAYLQAGRWRGLEYGGMISGSIIGVIGFGRIGRAVASRLQPWGVSILAHDPYPSSPMDGISFVDQETLLSESDIVTLHCAAVANNRHLINHDSLALMKRNALLINTGRGSLVDTAALVAALKEGRIAGAGLDVFEQEPPDPAHELFTLPNLLTTPHVAAWTLEVFLERRWRAARNLQAMLSGAPCADLVNPEALRHPQRAIFKAAPTTTTGA